MKTYTVLMLLVTILLAPAAVADASLDDVTMRLREKNDAQINKRLHLPEKGAVNIEKRKPHDSEKKQFRGSTHHKKMKAMKFEAKKIPLEKRTMLRDSNTIDNNIVNEKNRMREKKKLDVMYKKVNLIKDDKIRKEKLEYLDSYRKKIQERGVKPEKIRDIDKAPHKKFIKKAKTKKSLDDIRRKVDSIKDPVIREKTIQYLREAHKKMDEKQ